MRRTNPFDLTNPTRRALLCAAPLLAVPLALSAAPDPETPLRRMFREWDAAVTRVRAHNLATDPWGARSHLRVASDDEVLTLRLQCEAENEPATNCEDLLLKIMMVTDYLSGPQWQLSKECRAFLEGRV